MCGSVVENQSGLCKCCTYCNSVWYLICRHNLIWGSEDEKVLNEVGRYLPGTYYLYIFKKSKTWTIFKLCHKNDIHGTYRIFCEVCPVVVRMRAMSLVYRNSEGRERERDTVLISPDWHVAGRDTDMISLDWQSCSRHTSLDQTQSWGGFLRH